MGSKYFEPFVAKSKCCKSDVRFIRTKNVGYVKCEGCGKECDCTQPKTKHERFTHFIEKERDCLNYYTNKKREGNENFEKMKLLDSVREEWEKIYFS